MYKFIMYKCYTCIQHIVVVVVVVVVVAVAVAVVVVIIIIIIIDAKTFHTLLSK